MATYANSNTAEGYKTGASLCSSPTQTDHNEEDDLPLLHWVDHDEQDEQLSHENMGVENAESASKQGTANTMESKIDKMLELYISLNDKIQRSSSTSKGRLTELKTAHNSLIGVIKIQRSEIVDCYTRVNDLEHAQMQVQCDLLKAKNLIFDLISTVGMLSTRIEELERISMDQSVEIKEKKLILAGIPESKKEDIKKIALEKLKLILTKSSEAQAAVGYKGPKFSANPEALTRESIDAVYRLGKPYKNSKGRNIFVSFVKASTRHLILKAKNSVNMEKDLEFYVNEDMSLETRNLRAELKRVTKTAKELGLESKVAGNKVFVDGQSYTSSELDLLPSCLNRCCAQEKWVQGGLAFRGEKSVFSNFFARPFVIDGCKYISVEQYLQYSKATYYEKSALARKILMTTNPFKIQYYGDRIKLKGDEFDDWIEYCSELLHTGMYAKFTQNPTLKADLLSTGDYMLYEATIDYYFGCGINLTSKKWEDQSWEGDNLTGRALVEVRDRIKLENMDEETQPCDTSFATSTDCQSFASGEEPEYKIYNRKARMVPHTSTLCHTMVRKVRPNRKTRTRPPIENQTQNVTARSMARRSNFNDSGNTQDQSASLERDAEAIEEEGVTPTADPSPSASPL